MAKEKEIIILEGVIIDSLPNAMFKVEVINDSTTEDAPKMVVTARLSGRIRKNNIHVIREDKVQVEVTPYDLTKGRIIYRYKGDKKEETL